MAAKPESLLAQAERILRNPDVAVVPRPFVEQQFRDAKFHGASQALRVWKDIATKLKWIPRYEAEQSKDYD